MMNKTVATYCLPLAFLGVVIAALTALPAVAPPSAAELAEVGIGYVKANKAPLAETYFARALAKDPTNFRANFGAGNLALDQNHLNTAARELSTAAKADPKNAEVVISLGVAYQKMGQLPQADAAYQDAMKLDPRNPKPVYNMAFLEMQRAHYGPARDDLQRYLKLAPNAPNKLDVLARIAQLNAVLKGKS